MSPESTNDYVSDFLEELYLSGVKWRWCGGGYSNEKQTHRPRPGSKGVSQSRLPTPSLLPSRQGCFTLHPRAEAIDEPQQDRPPRPRAPFQMEVVQGNPPGRQAPAGRPRHLRDRGEAFGFPQELLEFQEDIALDSPQG